MPLPQISKGLCSHRLQIKPLAFLFIFSVVLFSALPASALTPVDTELSLLIDTSASIGNKDFLIQQEGYVNAFKSIEFENAIKNGRLGKIAINVIFWSSKQVEAIGWTLIDPYGLDGLTPSEFGDLMAATPRSRAHRMRALTDISSAIDMAVPLFTENLFLSDYQVIDISGDGTDNLGADPADSRDAALASGIDSINGIVIGNSRFLYRHYLNEVVGGSNHLLLSVKDFSGFEQAIKTKLVWEITPAVPEPTSLLLFGTGLLGLIGLRQRKV